MSQERRSRERGSVVAKEKTFNADSLQGWARKSNSAREAAGKQLEERGWRVERNCLECVPPSAPSGIFRLEKRGIRRNFWLCTTP